MAISLEGDLVCILADCGLSVFSVYHGSTVKFEDTPGRRVCITAAHTLDTIEAEHLAWYMACGEYGQEGMEDYLQGAIFQTCGFYVPLCVLYF